MNTRRGSKRKQDAVVNPNTLVTTEGPMNDRATRRRRDASVLVVRGTAIVPDFYFEQKDLETISAEEFERRIQESIQSHAAANVAPLAVVSPVISPVTAAVEAAPEAVSVDVDASNESTGFDIEPAFDPEEFLKNISIGMGPFAGSFKANVSQVEETEVGLENSALKKATIEVATNIVEFHEACVEQIPGLLMGTDVEADAEVAKNDIASQLLYPDYAVVDFEHVVLSESGELAYVHGDAGAQLEPNVSPLGSIGDLNAYVSNDHEQGLGDSNDAQFAFVTLTAEEQALVTAFSPSFTPDLESLGGLDSVSSSPVSIAALDLSADDRFFGDGEAMLPLSPSSPALQSRMGGYSPRFFAISCSSPASLAAPLLDEQDYFSPVNTW